MGYHWQNGPYWSNWQSKSSITSTTPLDQCGPFSQWYSGSFSGKWCRRMNSLVRRIIEQVLPRLVNAYLCELRKQLCRWYSRWYCIIHNLLLLSFHFSFFVLMIHTFTGCTWITPNSTWRLEFHSLLSHVIETDTRFHFHLDYSLTAQGLLVSVQEPSAGRWMILVPWTSIFLSTEYKLLVQTWFNVNMVAIFCPSCKLGWTDSFVSN